MGREEGKLEFVKLLCEAIIHRWTWLGVVVKLNLIVLLIQVLLIETSWFLDTL